METCSTLKELEHIKIFKSNVELRKPENCPCHLRKSYLLQISLMCHLIAFLFVSVEFIVSTHSFFWYEIFISV